MGQSESSGKIVIEAAGEDCEQTVENLVNLLDVAGELDRIHIELELETPIERGETLQESIAALTGAKEGTEGIEFEADSDAFKLCKLLYKHDREGWCTTPEIRRLVPEDMDINKDRISQILWDLSERNIIEKRDYEEDQRMNEYRLSEYGAESVEEYIEAE